MLELNQHFSRVSRSMTRDLLGYMTRDNFVSFASGAPDTQLLDHAGLRQCIETTLDNSGPAIFQYGPTEGEPELRQALAKEMAHRGLTSASADDILVYTGSQEFLFLIAQAMINPGDVVLTETPTYPAAIQAFTMAGARVIGVECDDDGVLPQNLDQALKQHNPKAVYLIPAFHNPRGVTMSPERKTAIRGVLANYPALLIEDDAYSPLAFDGQPVEPLTAGLESENGAAYMASLSKFVSPGLRLGGVLLPRWLYQTALVAKQVSTLHSSVLDQRAVATWLGSDRRQPTLQTMRTTYQQRATAMRAALTDALPEGTHLTQPAGGMFIWADLPTDNGQQWDTLALIDQALEREVAFVPGTEFVVDEALGKASLRFSFASNPTEVMQRGVARIAELFAAQR